MVVMLISLSIMAIMMTVVMPVWKQTAQREKEAELVFRGEQYARAISLFQRKSGPGTLPPNLNVLVDQRFLRKKYKDPITNDDFATIGPSTAAPGTTAGTPSAPPGSQTAGASGFGRGATPPPGQPGQAGAPAAGGIMGVASKSKDKSIRLYKGRSHYNEWAFVFNPPIPAGGTAAPGQRGTGGNQGRGNPQGPPPPGGPGGRQGNPTGGRGPNGPGNPNGPNNPSGPGRGGGFGPPGR